MSGNQEEQSAAASAKHYIDQFLSANSDDRMVITSEAVANLSKTQLKVFKKSVKSIEDEERKADESSEDEVKVTPGPSTEGGTKPSGAGASGKGKEKVVEDIEVADKIVELFWKELEQLSGDELMDEQVVKDFQYVGFDPNQIMKSIITIGRRAKKDDATIMKDIASMCTVAIIKGSITEKNLKKMSDAGKRTYQIMEASYGLHRGGSKGLDPKVVSIARVGAAFPGSMMKILIKRPDLAKKFSGPFGSKILPSYLRHQSAAACIPETLEEAAKTFLLGVITAYTSDQSKTISKSKESALELYERQENFINQTHSSHYPSEDVRKSIFRTWSLSADYDKIKTVADNITKVNKSFEAISKDDFVRALSGF